MSGIQFMGVLSVTAYGGAPGAAGAEEAAPPDSLLPGPVSQLLMSGDPGAMIAALGVESAQSEEDTSRKIEETQTKIQEQDETQEVAEMHQKASDMRSAALEGAIIGSVAGMLTSGAAGTADGTASKATLTAAGKLLETTQQYVKQNADAHAEDVEADITQLKDDAAHAGTASSQAYDNERDGRKLLDAAADFFREYSSAKEQSQAAAVFKS